MDELILALLRHVDLKQALQAPQSLSDWLSFELW